MLNYFVIGCVLIILSLSLPNRDDLIYSFVLRDIALVLAKFFGFLIGVSAVLYSLGAFVAR